jgi:hypothetical protein
VEADLGLATRNHDVVLDETVGAIQLANGRIIPLGSQPVLHAAMTFLVRNGTTSCNRATFYEQLWHTTYDAEIHEPKVIKTAQRLRQLLGNWTDGGSVLWMSVATGIRIRPDLRVGLLEPITPGPAQLSPRQQAVLRSLDGSTPLPASELQTVAGVKTTTILMELRHLIDRGMVEPVGAGRATRYRKKPGSP